MGYTLLLQNNGSKQEYIITGLTDTGNFLAYVFDGFEMPDGAGQGEYTGILFYDGREDTEYQLSDVLLNTICRTGEGNVCVRDLRPEIFLLKYSTPEDRNEYRQNNNDYVYYRG